MVAAVLPRPPSTDPPVDIQPHRLALSVEQAAEQLGISRAGAYRLIADGQLPSKRLGRRIVIPRESLERFLVSS